MASSASPKRQPRQGGENTEAGGARQWGSALAGYGIEPLLPIRAQWPDVKLGDEHAHEFRKLDPAGGQVKLVEINLLVRKGVDLDIQERRDIQMRIVGSGRFGMPVIDVEFSINMVQEPILVRDDVNRPSSCRADIIKHSSRYVPEFHAKNA